jgi:hypothetical protein
LIDKKKVTAAVVAFFFISTRSYKVSDWYYLKSPPTGTGIKLVPDLGHTRLVWYLIPVFILVLIPVSDPTYQTNTG